MIDKTIAIQAIVSMARQEFGPSLSACVPLPFLLIGGVSTLSGYGPLRWILRIGSSLYSQALAVSARP